MSLRLRVWFFAIAIALSAQSVLTQRAGSIDTIAPAAARPGDSVTITGRGFGAINVRITVGGVPAVVLAANGNRVTFVVPAGVPQGATTVTAINPGGQSGSIAFQIIEGVLLAGTPSSLAVDATVDLREIGVDPSLIDHHVILTRLDVRLAPDATVGQINAALIRVGGGIVSMSQHEAMMTISVPRQPSIAALQTLADTLSGTPGILIALVGRTLQSQVLPASSSALREEHTLPTRFPAAWNVMSLAARNCETRRVPVLVADAFIQPEPNSHVGFDVQIPVFDYAPLAAVGTETHGYDVTTTLGALFDDHILTGANPLANCLSIHGVEVDGVTMGEVIDRVVDHLPNERFIMNLSQGFAVDCDVITLPSGDSSCTPASIQSGVFRPLSRAWYAAYWKKKTQARWNDFFATASAGNNADEVVALRYPGLREAPFNSFLTTAKEDDPFYDFITNTAFWQGTLDPNLPDLTATPQEVEQLRQAILVDHLDTVGGAPNVLTVGSTTPGTTFSDLHLSAFSGIHADVAAVGEHVPVFSAGASGGGNSFVDGTSFSAPQVAGLASYLWLLSDDLRRNRSIETTRRDIAANARLIGRDFVIDGYATVLSLDGAQLPTPQSAPVRLALFDVDNSGHFDEADLQIFAAHLFDAAGGPVSPSTRDYSRYDLNGDGFTGGSGTESFDLDRVGSAQYNAPLYDADITQTIEGGAVHYNEERLTDVEILCYYAYSALYSGDPVVRAQLLPGCSGVTVSVAPATTTVAPAGTRQFSATVHGSADPRVTWSAGGGTISTTGLFTAGGTAGVFTVRATSVADPRSFGEGHVTIAGCGGPYVKLLTLGNHTDVLHFVRENEPGAIDEQLPGPHGFSSGVVDVSSASLTATDPDTRADIGARGQITGVNAVGQFADSVTLMPLNPALIGTEVTFTLTASVTADLVVTGDHASGSWSLFLEGLFAQGRTSTIAGRSLGDQHGGTYSVIAGAILGQPSFLGATLSATAGLDGVPGEPFPPPTFTGSASGHVGVSMTGISNVRDQLGAPVQVTVCSAGGGF